MKYLYILQQALVWALTIYWAYQVVISFCSLIKLKDKPFKVNKEHKFMAIIPAHNEETVIKNLVDSLKMQNYPKELLDIYVIADNCDDNTAKIAEEAGAIVLKRFDSEKKTKGYALNWFLGKKIEENADYDAFCVFDADNIVDKDFIKNMNKKLCQGEVVVQGYRDIKNPTDSWVSAGYALFYWMMNRFYHLARYNAGMSPLINGTGFMVRFDIIKETGWNTKTLTEDIEFSLMNIAAGRKLGWATDAKVYDEQPVSFKQSWSQRERWTVGHIQCLKYYTKDLANGVKKNKTITSFDGLLYVMCIPIMILTLAIVFLNTLLYLGDYMTGMELLYNYIKYGLTSMIMPAIVAMVSMKLDKKPIKPMIKGILCYPIFMTSWLLINIKCLIKPNTNWEKIKHVRSVDIKEII